MSTRLTHAAAVAASLLVVATGCGSASDDRATDSAPGADASTANASGPVSAGELLAASKPLDTDAKDALRAFDVDAADPEFPISDPKEFETVVAGTVAGFVPGPKQPVFEGDPDPIETVVMKLDVASVLSGEAQVGQRLYVRLFIDDLAGLKRAIPKGTTTLTAVSAVEASLDDQLVDPYAGVPKGAPRYIAGAPYAAFADGKNATWFPLLDETEEKPLTALAPPE